MIFVFMWYVDRLQFTIGTFIFLNVNECTVLDVDDIDELTAIFDLDLESAQFVPYLYESFTQTLKLESELYPDVVAEYEAAFRFLEETKFPNFPLGK